MPLDVISEKVHSGDEGPFLSVLVEPRQEVRDLKLLNRAIRNRWDIPAEYRTVMVNRLIRIVEKESVTVMTRTGPCCLEEPADRNAILAAKVLIGMEGQNQQDEQAGFNSLQRGADTTINIGAVGNMTLGQEPLTASDAKRQAEEILRRVLERAKPPVAAQVATKLMDSDLSQL